MRSILLSMLLLSFFSTYSQRTNADRIKIKSSVSKYDSIKVFTIPSDRISNTVSELNTGNNTNTQKVVLKSVNSSYINDKYFNLIKLNIELNPANPKVQNSYLSCCNCCTETTVKTFSSNGVYTFTPRADAGYSTVSALLSVNAGSQYLVRMKGSSNQARNFTVSFASGGEYSFKVPANDYEITFICKPQKAGYFSFTFYSNEPGLWSFYNCIVTEL